MRRNAWYGEQILTDHGTSSIKDYTYKGGDKSLIYKYITGKLAQLVVDHWYPETLAPNLITLIGWIIVISPHIIFLYLNPFDFAVFPPRWVCALQGIVMFIYSVMDNSDGKQARKIGASSPLGLMFDHGLDMVNTCLGSITLCRIMMFGNNDKVAVLVVMMSLLQFYYATLEEYFIDGLFLPIINAVNEGLFVVIFVCLSTAALGPEIWHSTLFGYKLNKYIFVMLAITSLFVIIQNFITIIKISGVLDLIHKSLLISYLTGSVLVFIYLTKNTNLIQEYQLLIMYFYGFMVSRIVNGMQTNHLCNEDFDQIQYPIFIWLIGFNIATGFLCYYEVTKQTFLIMTGVLFGSYFIYYCLYVISMVNIMADTLGIYVFTVGKIEKEEFDSQKELILGDDSN